MGVHLIAWNYLDSNEASFNILDTVTSSIHLFAMYIADGLFNTPISFSFMLTLHPTMQQFAQGKLVWKEWVRSKPLLGKITFRILFFVPATN